MPDNIDWENLNEPQKFFHLQDDYNKKDLKRAYTKFIKKFKPEQHPEEFQKIRHAYEVLEEQLAYNIKAPKVPEVKIDLESNLPKQVSEESEAVIPPPKSFIQLLQENGATTLLTQLQVKAQKSIDDFLALAILAEKESNDPGDFLKQIAEGLTAYPESPELNDSLYQFCQAHYPVTMIPKFLAIIEETPFNFSFFYLTEPLWQTLLDAGEIDLFIDCYKRVEAASYDSKNNNSIFLIRQVKSYFFCLPQEWKERQVQFIDENSFDLDAYWEHEINFIETLQNYEKSLEGFLAVHPFRQEIHSTFRDCLEKDFYRAKESFIALQQKILTQNQLEEVFPDKDTSANSALTLLTKLHYDFLPEIEEEEEFDQSSSAAMALRVKNFSRDMDVQINKGLSGRAFQLLAATYWIAHIFITLFIMLPLSYYLLSFFDLDDGLTTLFGIGFGALYLIVIRKYLLDKYKNKLFLWLCSKTYNHKIRRHIIDFFIQNQFKETSFCHHIDAMIEEDEFISPGYIGEFLPHDYAPSFAAIASKFQ